ncbi:putative O-methyltransferase YrrM [Maribacter vaceletii]|uniref:Putative O-methyltransferase YrrM n=1 Tax=Maribacter vaceletii TaxID=1206816 RepID=A0A495E7V8_9FLAO|nr:class I SAM-dependent methyltransferase [Maribacter vaceletii]RKR13014.1 putative O-methyltransferase YrrM [Maribacter vaceletii]
MHIIQDENINEVLNELFKDAKNDRLRMMKSFAKNPFRAMKPIDFKEVYLSISKHQGEELVSLIKKNNLKNIVEFGTSFGISTLFLAEGAIQTKGSIITTELIESKAKKAKENFKKAGVDNLIEVREGNALETLKSYNKPIDLLLLDGWKDLYLPLFKMLEPNFHENTIVYVDNADMADSQEFLKSISKNNNYQLQSKFDGKVVLIHVKK